MSLAARQAMDKLLVWVGAGLVALGLLTMGVGALLAVFGVRGGRLLPGDIAVSRPGFTFVFPVVTCLVLSALLTLALWVIAALRRG
jgi:multisubunit Na+/H+ antiporter MnhC subunit